MTTIPAERGTAWEQALVCYCPHKLTLFCLGSKKLPSFPRMIFDDYGDLFAVFLLQQFVKFGWRLATRGEEFWCSCRFSWHVLVNKGHLINFALTSSVLHLVAAFKTTFWWQKNCIFVSVDITVVFLCMEALIVCSSFNLSNSRCLYFLETEYICQCIVDFISQYYIT